MTPEERLKKESLLRLLIEEKVARDKDRLKNLVPNRGFQENFRKSVAKVRLITAGNQSGKTHIGAAESGCYALGEHPHKKIRTPNTGIIISGQGFKTGVEQIIVPKLKAVLGSTDIRSVKNNSQGVPTKIIFRNGSVAHLMSSEQDDDVFEGTTVDWCWIDEPVRRSIFIAIKRGMLTTGGHLWMTCTPLDEPWIYEDIYMPGIQGTDPDIAVFEGSSDENTRISQEDKDEFKKHLTKDEIDARWHGKFRHLEGRVFKSYRPDVHRIPSFDIPPHWPVYLSVDPHKNKPHAVLFLAVAPNGIKYVCNEIYHKCSIKTLADEILSVSAPYNIVRRMIDTSAQEEDWKRESARQILQRNGVTTCLAQKKNLKNSGIILINQAFESDELFVMEHCVRTHREFQNQIFKKNKRDSAQVLEEPEKKWDDQTDNLRYILVERPQYRISSRIKTSAAPYTRN